MIKYLNLSKGFRISNVGEISYKSFKFEGGEPHIQLLGPIHLGEKVVITTRITNGDDFILLALAVDALRNRMLEVGKVPIELILPYVPGARQDRIMNAGEPFTAKLYADFINNLKLDLVTILDPHSDVVVALLNNCKVISNHEFVTSIMEDMGAKRLSQEVIIVSPDAGANKKSLKLIQYLDDRFDRADSDSPNLVKCDKTREISTGKITNFEVYADDLKGVDCLIVDDICDGGGTFIGLAKELKKKNAGKIFLAVTHGIFSKGFRELNSHFSGIYTTDSFPNVDNDQFMMRWDKQTNKVAQIKLKEFME